jgi:hypothetical protein
MSKIVGLAGMSKAMEKTSYASGEDGKAKWLKIEDGEKVIIRFLQELDPNSPNYDAKLGYGFFAVEHTSPKDYRRKALCSFDDEGRCYGCEQNRLNPKTNWNAKKRLYVNVLVNDGKNDPYVAILSQGISGKTITPTVAEYADLTGSVTNLTWQIKRSGTKTDTSYTIIPIPAAKDEKPFDFSSVELFDLDKTAVRSVPYSEQAAFYTGDSSPEERESSSTSSSVDW